MAAPHSNVLYSSKKESRIVNRNDCRLLGFYSAQSRGIAATERNRKRLLQASACADAAFPRLLPRSLLKEVIQPQVLLRLPCYDFTPIMNHTLGRCLLTVSAQTSSTIHFRDVTGGVYKARERIHAVVLIRHY